MRISVFGIGYVGVVSCGCLAELGHEVIGVDIAAEKIAMLAGGRSPIVEEAIDELIGNPTRAQRLLQWRAETPLEELCRLMVEADIRRNKIGFSF